MHPIFHEDKHEAVDYEDYLGRFFMQNRGKRPPDTRGPDLPVALAYISEGRWVARCSACPNAVLISRVTPYMLCSNVKCVVDYWQVVVMPLEDFEVLGELVMKRPNEANQNWELDETLDGDPLEFIRLENKLHGVA